MSSELLAAHLAAVNAFIKPAGADAAKGGKKAKKVKKTARGLPLPTIKVGKKRQLTSYIGAATEALKRSEERLQNIVAATASQMKKKRKTRSDAMRVIKAHRTAH